MSVLEFSLELPGVSRSALWGFHRDPSALARLTPPEKEIRIVERPKEMYAGARVVLEVRQFGLWLTWISVIETWEPEERFVDVQERGPFASWRHEHLFYEGRLLDRVAYEVPLSALGGALADRALVRPDLERMFAHRHRVTKAAFAGI